MQTYTHKLIFTPDMLTAYRALVANAEGCIIKSVGDVGDYIWRDVYLDNAKPNGWSPRKWAGVLSQLEKAGCYIRNDSVFGTVRMPVGAL